MPQIPETAEFTVGADQAIFTTKTNGDILKITGLHLPAEQAAALAYLVNQPNKLKIEVKVVDNV